MDLHYMPQKIQKYTSSVDKCKTFRKFSTKTAKRLTFVSKAVALMAYKSRTGDHLMVFAPGYLTFMHSFL